MNAESRARRWGAVSLEAFGSLLLVLALFSLFIMFLYALFPSGTPLKELMESTLAPGPGRYAGGRQSEATLSTLERDVRFRRGNSIAWGGASEGMQLYSQDAVQTLDNSGARISFGAKDQLLLGSNSLIVVTRLSKDDEAGPKSYRVQVDGELRGSLSAARKLRMEFAAAGHLARISPGVARFRVTPNGKNSASLAVYAGEAQVVGKRGVIRVPANFGVTLKKGVPVGPAVPLPAAPLLDGPDKAVYRYRLLPPKVRFSWGGAAGEYHFQLAKEPGFRKCLMDEKPATPEFSTGKLAKGHYYWRVSRLSQGQEGAFSRVGECQLLQQLNAPGLSVNFPPENAPSGPYLLSGSSEPGSRIFVDGIEVASQAPGRFTHELRLKPGVNLIRIEAVDAAGNASYASQIVYGRSAPEAPDAAFR